MSTRSISPKLMKKDVTVMSMSSARRNPITSFSCVGTPYGAHEAPTRLSHAGPVTFSWVKVISMPLRLTPRSVSRCRRLTLAPTNTRPRPSVWARSLNTEPGERDVGTRPPPAKRNVEPALVALTGRFATFWLIAVPMNEIRVPLADTAEGTKWSACSAVAESEPAVPPRKSGSLPSAKMNSWEILSRRPCASSGVAASVNATRLHRHHRIGPPSRGVGCCRLRRDAARGPASTRGAPRSEGRAVSRPLRLQVTHECNEGRVKPDAVQVRIGREARVAGQPILRRATQPRYRGARSAEQRIGRRDSRRGVVEVDVGGTDLFGSPDVFLCTVHVPLLRAQERARAREEAPGVLGMLVQVLLDQCGRFAILVEMQQGPSNVIMPEVAVLIRRDLSEDSQRLFVLSLMYEGARPRSRVTRGHGEHLLPVSVGQLRIRRGESGIHGDRLFEQRDCARQVRGCDRPSPQLAAQVQVVRLRATGGRST